MVKVYIALALLLAGMVLGVGATTWFFKSGEIRALNHQIRAMSDARRESDARALQVVTRVAAELDMSRREIARLQRRAAHEIQDIADCGYGIGAVRLLNEARGYPPMPGTTAEPDAAAGATPRHPLSDSAGFWIADIGEYNACVSQLNGLIDYLRAR